MLENQLWMKYAIDLSIEYKQAVDEGKEVKSLKTVCDQIATTSQHEDCEVLAKEVREKLLHAKVRADYPFFEPSDLNEITHQKPVRRHQFINTLSDETLKDKLSGAWIGRISGCLLGKPIECMKRDEIYAILKPTNNYPMRKYITYSEFTEELKQCVDPNKWRTWADNLKGMAPIDDDTNYTVLMMKMVEQYGKEFRPNDVLEAWLTWMPMFATCTAERVAYKNAAMGLYAPETATYNNPYREWIGAQIRGDFFGYINPGSCEKAAEMAWRDASISHVKNGIYGEMFVAAMIAAASVCDDMMTVIEAGIDEIPKKSRLAHDIELVLNWYHDGVSAQEVIENIHQLYDECDSHGWCHTNSNAMIVVMALLYGEKDFSQSICLSVQAAFDTDCNGATVGSVIGMMVGEKAIPPYWYECYNQKLETSISGYNIVSIEELTAKTFELLKA